MTDYGVTPTGFVKKDLETIRDEIKDDLRDLLRPTLGNAAEKLNLLDTSVLGILIGVIGDKFREDWDVQQAVYRAMYPDSASDEALDQVASITGAKRLKAEESQATLDQLFLDDGVTIPVGSIVSVGSTGARFTTTAEVSNSTGVPGTFSTTAQSEDTGEIIGYAGTIDTIQTSISGWNAAAALTCDTSEDYTLDGTSLTIKVDRGSEQVVNFSGGDPWSAADVAAQIETDTDGIDAYAAAGQVRIASETEGAGSVIQVTGGSANIVLQFSTNEIKGFNSEDAVVGTEVETDPDFRLRREELLRVVGAATVEAIRAGLREIEGVIQALVVENTDIVTSIEGLPPKSFESIVHRAVWDSEKEQEVADKIWLKKPAGIETHGTETEVVTDSMGFTHNMKYSKPTEVPIYQALSVTTNDDYPLDGDDQVKQALKEYGDTLQVGEDVIALQFQCVPLSVAGVVDVTAFTIDTITPPVGTGNITIDYNELATFDTGNISVTSS